MSLPTTAPHAFLRSDVKITPLVYRWPAWSHLIAPATQALNLAYRHLPKLRSFVANPAAHMAASRNPAMAGGPFVTLQQTDVERVRRYLDEVENICVRELEFAAALRELDLKMQVRAKGFCLDEFVRDLPAALAGRVELVYDLACHARIKVIEELLYGSELDTRRGQGICLQVVADSERPFFMSAPMLDAPNRVFVPIAYDDSRIDQLASMRRQAGSVDEMRSRLEICGAAGAVFDTFFTHQSPLRISPEYLGDGVRVRYFGHACVLVQTARTAILVDPVTAWDREDSEATLTFDDLPESLDYLVLTHAHQDHLVPEMLLQLRQRVGKVVLPGNDRGNLADPSMKLILRAMGYRDVCSLSPFESIEFGDGELMSLPFLGEHAGLDINSKQCIALRAKGRTLIFLVNTDAIDGALYRAIARRVGRVDTLFIGMECRGAPLSWLYGPLLTKSLTRRDDESRRLSGSNCESAWRVVEAFGCSAVFVYAMGQERWLASLMGLAYTPDSVQIRESDQLVDRCRKAGLIAERLKGCKEFEW